MWIAVLGLAVAKGLVWSAVLPPWYGPDEASHYAYVQELVGLVVGQGFKALIKPESWAASHAADHVVRAQGKRVGWPSGEALVRKTS